MPSTPHPLAQTQVPRPPWTTSRPKNLPLAGHKAVRHTTCFKWPGHPPSDSQPVTWRGRRPEGHRCQVFRLRTTVYLPCKVTRTLLGDRGKAGCLQASPPSHAGTRPVTWSSSPEWAAGVPLLQPATAPPRSARAQSLYGHQKTHRVCNARKRDASCFLARPPPCHPPAPNKSASPLSQRRPPRGVNRGCKDNVQRAPPRSRR